MGVNEQSGDCSVQVQALELLMNGRVARSLAPHSAKGEDVQPVVVVTPVVVPHGSECA
jgi:hypothetical protein